MRSLFSATVYICIFNFNGCMRECECECECACNCEGLSMVGHGLFLFLAFLFHFIDQIPVCSWDICALFHQRKSIRFFFCSQSFFHLCSIFVCYLVVVGFVFFLYFFLFVLQPWPSLMLAMALGVRVRNAWNQRRQMLYFSLSVFWVNFICTSLTRFSRSLALSPWLNWQNAAVFANGWCSPFFFVCSQCWRVGFSQFLPLINILLKHGYDIWLWWKC